MLTVVIDIWERRLDQTNTFVFRKLLLKALTSQPEAVVTLVNAEGKLVNISKWLVF